VRDNSRAALVWLRDEPTNIKCVTSKGRLVEEEDAGFEEELSFEDDAEESVYEEDYGDSEDAEAREDSDDPED